MKKILVPTDFSICAKAAEDTAMEMACVFNAEIHFLHTIFTPVDWVKISLKRENLYPETKKQISVARNELNKLVLRAEKLGLKASVFIAFDKGSDEINRHAIGYKNDFIVMGTYGTKGIKELIGSNTQKVIRYSTVPVLAIKKKLKKSAFKNIVFASDFEEEIRSPFRVIKDFADKMNSKIHLLFVNTPSYFEETDISEMKMGEFIKKSSPSSCSVNIYNAFNTESGILKFSKSENIDLISLVTHGRTGVMRFISPSIVEDIVNHSEKPVLSIKLLSKK